MKEETSGIPVSEKPKRQYKKRQPIEQSAPNPNIAALENDYVAAVRQRSAFVQKVNIATAKLNQANLELKYAQEELSQVDGNIQFLAHSIAQLKGVPIQVQPQFTGQFQAASRLSDFQNTVPQSPTWTPAIPFPSGDVSSLPANNRGIHRDASPPQLNGAGEIANTASAVDFMTPELRAQFHGKG